jgi:hypothetical protein
LNQLVFCHQLVSLGDGVAGASPGVAGALGEDEETSAPAPQRRRRMFSGSAETAEPFVGAPLVWAGAYAGFAGGDSTAAMAGPDRNAESAAECTAAGSSGRWVAAVIEKAGRGAHAGAFARSEAPRRRRGACVTRGGVRCRAPLVCARNVFPGRRRVTLRGRREMDEAKPEKRNARRESCLL